MNHKNKFIITLIIPIIFNMVLFSIIGTLLFNYDHLQLKKKDYYDANKFTALPNMRLQTKGITNYFNFDGILLGTSMLANSSAMDAAKIFGGTFVNLSTLAARPYERGVILEDIFKHKKLKNVIYTLDEYYKPKEESSQRDGWQFLYDTYKINDLWVLLDAKYIIGALKSVLSPYTSYNFDIIDHIDISTNVKKANIEFFDKPIEWISKKNNSSRFGGLENWVKNIYVDQTGKLLLQNIPKNLHDIKTLPKLSYADVNVEKEIQYLEKYLLSFVQKHPQTNFYIIFPPYYRYYYAANLQTNGKKYYIHQKIIRYMVESAEKYKNLHIFAFEDLDYLDDIANYMDYIHYNTDMNDLMSRAMANNEHRITLKNIDAYLAKCEQLALAFDIQEFYEKSQRLLHEHKKPTTWQEFLKTSPKIMP